MSPRVSITKYKTGSGPRYRVRYRLGGRDFRPVHIASFEKLKDARACQDWAQGVLAAGGIPDLGAHLAAQHTEPTVPEAVRAWLKTRVNLHPERKRAYERAAKRAGEAFSSVRLSRLTGQQVAEWSAAMERDGLEAGPRKDALSVLRQALDMHEVHPNPAAARYIPRPPKERQSEIMPPPHAHWQVILDGVTAAVRLPLRMLEGTGLRGDELVSLAWGDLDFRDSRLRVRSGKTRAARRMVPVPASLMEALDALVPREDRRPDDPVFPGLRTGTMRQAMRRACMAAGIPVYSPHDLRHRFISLLVKRGMDPAAVAQLAGHSRKEMTLSVYTHVILEDL